MDYSCKSRWVFLKISTPYPLYSCTVGPAQSKTREHKLTDTAVKCHPWRCQRNEDNIGAWTRKGAAWNRGQEAQMGSLPTRSWLRCFSCHSAVSQPVPRRLPRCSPNKSFETAWWFHMTVFNRPMRKHRAKSWVGGINVTKKLWEAKRAELISRIKGFLQINYCLYWFMFYSPYAFLQSRS